MKTLFKNRIGAKKIHRGCIRIQSMTMAKTISQIKHKKIEQEKWQRRWKSVVKINGQCCV